MLRLDAPHLGYIAARDCPLGALRVSRREFRPEKMPELKPLTHSPFLQGRYSWPVSLTSIKDATIIHLTYLFVGDDRYDILRLRSGLQRQDRTELPEASLNDTAYHRSCWRLTSWPIPHAMQELARADWRLRYRERSLPGVAGRRRESHSTTSDESPVTMDRS